MSPRSPRNAGFTLVEALAAVAALASILLALSSVAGQWMPHWRHGFEAVQRADLLAQSLDRIVADLSEAQCVRLDPGSPAQFRGDASAVMFVRQASGPEARPALEYVRIGSASTEQGLVTQRSHAPFAPGPIGRFRDAVVVFQPPFRLIFAYQSLDGRWTTSWGLAKMLPRAMRLTVTKGAAVVAMTAFLLRTPTGPEFNAPQPQGLKPTENLRWK